MALNVLVLPIDINSQVELTKTRVGTALGVVLDADDGYVIGDESHIDAEAWDLAIAWDACGWSRFAAPLAAARIPSFCLTPQLCFHPYMGSFHREMEKRGGILLPSANPGRIAASVAALRAKQALADTTLIVVDRHADGWRAEQVNVFAKHAAETLGITVVRRADVDLIALAEAQSDAAVDAEWARWLADVLDGPGEMPLTHMREVVRLYLAERAMLAEHGAQGITVDDIGSFLHGKPRRTMPNSSYAVLASDGYLVCEEGDIETLATEALLRAGLGAHPTMSNIYMAYREALDEAGSFEAYTPDLERADYLQCVADNHLVAAHFSTSGVLPPNMMEESRYRVRATVPAWIGESMAQSTPRLGTVVTAKLNEDASAVHLLSGVADSRTIDDRFGWYRGRWTIKIDSAERFVAHCLHQHYAIGPENGRSAVLDTLTGPLLGLRRVDPASFRG